MQALPDKINSRKKKSKKLRNHKYTMIKYEYSFVGVIKLKDTGRKLLITYLGYVIKVAFFTLWLFKKN